MSDEKTSKEIATLAGRVLAGYVPTHKEVLSLAATALGQAPDNLGEPLNDKQQFKTAADD